MRRFSKILTGAATAALVTVSTATPAQAQYRHYDRGGIDAGDVIAGVAIIGGIAAIASAIGNDRGRYGYDDRYGYRDGYTNAVNACGYEAQRYGRGRVQITDVDRRGRDRYRVRGAIDSGYGGYGYGNDRYGYGDDRYGYGDDRYGYGNRGHDRDRFTCTALGNGRITAFRTRG